ncbi:spermidine resistance protein [Lecanora helva]
MVDPVSPIHNTVSPPSYIGTPHLTINRDVPAGFDSTTAFEGPEKLLEVWFSASSTYLPSPTVQGGLKVVPSEVWKDMLDLVNCKILSVVESENVDAYLLSESSMFVFPHKLILKTCGTTTLLSGLPKILEIAALFAKFPHRVANYKLGTGTAAIPYRVFYSRKNFLFPDRQRGPHRSWRDEVRSLDKLFFGGSAYMIGKMNGEHWYLYLTEPNTVLTPPSTPESHKTQTKFLDLPSNQEGQKKTDIDHDDLDETLEMLMTDLDPSGTGQFYLDHASAVAETRYYEKAHKARLDAEEHIGDLSDLPSQPPVVKANEDESKATADENVDVFSNTSSDPAELMSSSNERLDYPQELTTEGHALGTVVSEISGLTDVYPTSKYPDARIDAYLFNPCGFSANGVIPAPNGPDATHYFTVHVTPERDCSYASFETNVPTKQSGRETADVIEQVVSIFKPGRFSVTLFEGKKTADDAIINNPDPTDKMDELKTLQRHVARKSTRLDHIEGYRRVDRIVHDLEGYELVFKYYERHDWKGGAPRLGETGF